LRQAFHRAYLLRFENSLLAVDPTIEGLPYWDYSEDTETGKYFETTDYIFSDKYFGSIKGNPDENYAITDGLFAYWPIAQWTSSRFGASSTLNSRCAKQEWFKGTTASVCDRCCGDSACECDQPGDTYSRFFRAHDDCTPYTARNPDEVTKILGTTNLQGTKPDFNVCTDSKNINSFMDWQNCIEFEQVSCLLLLSLGNCTDVVEKLVEKLQANMNPLLEALIKSPALSILCEECTLESFYYDTNNVKRSPQALHSQAHIRLGRDILDVTTSPNGTNQHSRFAHAPFELP
jgi:Common central domain of tyrosinase